MVDLLLIVKSPSGCATVALHTLINGMETLNLSTSASTLKGTRNNENVIYDYIKMADGISVNRDTTANIYLLTAKSNFSRGEPDTRQYTASWALLYAKYS